MKHTRVKSKLLLQCSCVVKHYLSVDKEDNDYVSSWVNDDKPLPFWSSLYDWFVSRRKYHGEVYMSKDDLVWLRDRLNVLIK